MLARCLPASSRRSLRQASSRPVRSISASRGGRCVGSLQGASPHDLDAGWPAAARPGPAGEISRADHAFSSSTSWPSSRRPPCSRSGSPSRRGGDAHPIAGRLTIRPLHAGRGDQPLPCGWLGDDRGRAAVRRLRSSATSAPSPAADGPDRPPGRRLPAARSKRSPRARGEPSSAVRLR